MEKTQCNATRLSRIENFGISTRAMLQNALARLKCQIQTIKCGVALLQPIDHPQALQIVFESAKGPHAFIERILTSMPKWSVAQVMRKTDGLDQIFIQSQRASDGAAQLRDFQRMGEPRAKQVTLMIYKNLGLVDQAPKGR